MGASIVSGPCFDLHFDRFVGFIFEAENLSKTCAPQASPEVLQGNESIRMDFSKPVLNTIFPLSPVPSSGGWVGEKASYDLPEKRCKPKASAVGHDFVSRYARAKVSRSQHKNCKTKLLQNAN